MDQYLLVSLITAFTGISVVFILFALLLLTSITLNRIFPVTDAKDKADNGTATPLHVSAQADDEIVAVIQAAITAHLKRSP
ncbi:MAG: OadG family protein [Nitrospinae bacterium]|nr:OadG family protein [Nitrospinota bacterium]MBF0633525.1 OadG family protein [Nitrospinota bacterium]